MKMCLRVGLTLWLPFNSYGHRPTPVFSVSTLTLTKTSVADPDARGCERNAHRSLLPETRLLDRYSVSFEAFEFTSSRAYL
jgi:hypothetical protein